MPIELTSGVSQPGSVSLRNAQHYQITSSAADVQLQVELTNLSADVDLYVRQEVKPTGDEYDCRSWESDTDAESCTLSNTAAVTWYITAFGYEAGEYSIKATLTTTAETSCTDGIDNDGDTDFDCADGDCY